MNERESGTAASEEQAGDRQMAFRTGDLQAYIRKYRLTRPLTLAEEQALNERLAQHRKHHPPAVALDRHQRFMHLLTILIMALVTMIGASLLLPIFQAPVG